MPSSSRTRSTAVSSAAADASSSEFRKAWFWMVTPVAPEGVERGERLRPRL
jgi:hypothetical protein